MSRPRRSLPTAPEQATAPDLPPEALPRTEAVATPPASPPRTETDRTTARFPSRTESDDVTPGSPPGTETDHTAEAPAPRTEADATTPVSPTHPETDGTSPHPVDETRPLGRILLFGVQHVLVMAATPISAIFLMSATLRLNAGLTVDLLSAAFVLSGVGSLIQSVGFWKFGPRLPFVMLPGGAPLILFLAIADAHGLRVAAGAVILTAVFTFAVLPLFARLLKFFPPLVIGTMIVIVGVNLVKVGAVLVTGRPGEHGFAAPGHLALGMATIGFTVVFHLLLRGVPRQLSVMLGLIAGTALALFLGDVSFGHLGQGGWVDVPRLMPFGSPRFDVLAALPLMLYSLASMAEATGQTVINAEAVGREIDQRVAVPRTVRGDALVSALGGLFGMPLMVTSGENIGIVRVTGVRSRFVTAAAGVVLIAIGFLAPVTRAISVVPAPVVGGTAMVVFAVITVLGVQMLARCDLDRHTNTFICAVALALGLLPILVPDVYQGFPATARILLESGVAVGAFVAAVLNVLFHHVGPALAARLSVRPDLRTEGTR